MFFTRLIMKADDFGGFYGNTKLLKSHLFPLKDFSHKKILPWIQECVDIGIIVYYEVDGKEYVRINDFGQRTRIMKSKFPDPPTNDGQMTVKCQTDDGLKPKPNRNQTETETEKETETEVFTHPSSGESDSSARFESLKELISWGVEKQVAQDFLKNRTTRRLAKTKTAFDSLRAEIEKTGRSPNEIIKLCAVKGWGAFKASWEWKKEFTPVNNQKDENEKDRFWREAEEQNWSEEKQREEWKKRFET